MRHFHAMQIESRRWKESRPERLILGTQSWGEYDKHASYIRAKCGCKNTEPCLSCLCLENWQPWLLARRLTKIRNSRKFVSWFDQGLPEVLLQLQNYTFETVMRITFREERQRRQWKAQAEHSPRVQYMLDYSLPWLLARRSTKIENRCLNKRNAREPLLYIAQVPTVLRGHQCVERETE